MLPQLASKVGLKKLDCSNPAEFAIMQFWINVCGIPIIVEELKEKKLSVWEEEWEHAIYWNLWQLPTLLGFKCDKLIVIGLIDPTLGLSTSLVWIKLFWKLKKDKIC